MDLEKTKRLAGMNLSEADINAGIFTKAIKKIEHATDINDHSGALVLGAQLIKDKELIAMTTALEMIRDAERHLSPDVKQVEERVRKTLMSRAAKKLSKEQNKMFHGAF